MVPSSDTPGDATSGSARPDHARTINEAGAASFVADGTDSFAVPGPVDAPPVDDVAASSFSRARVLGTVGAVVAGLTFVVAVGSGGGTGASEARLRSGDAADGPASWLPGWGRGGGGEPVVVPLEPTDGETLRRLAERAPTSASVDPYADGDVLGDDGEFVEDETIASYLDDLDDLDDLDELDDADDRYRDEDDADLPVFRPPSNVVPRRPTAPRAVVTVPRPPAAPRPTTTTTSATTTTTTTVGGTTTSAISTTTTATTAASGATTTVTPTTLPSAAEWQRAANGLPSCPASLQVWSQPDRLVAAAGDQLYQRTDGDWTPLGRAASVSSTVWAFAPGGDAATFWVGGDAGVFATTDGGATYQPLGALAGVRSLAAGPGGTLLAVTASEQLHRWGPGAAEWTPVRLPGAPGDVGEVIVVDAGDAFVGTSAGIARSSDGGSSWVSVATTAVVGSPVREGAELHWLARGGDGVLRSTDGGTTWTNIAPAGTVAPDARALAVVDGRVVTTGAVAAPQLIALTSADDGLTWIAAPFGSPPPYGPDGLVRQGARLFAFTSDCAAGEPDAVDSVLALVDP